MATAKFGLNHDAWGRLVLIDAEGRRHVGVEPIRAFPISEPNRGVALCDAEGREVAWVDDLADLPGPTRATLEDELARREFLPILRRIARIAGEGAPSDWEVETDRGTTRFTLDSEDHVRKLGPGRVLITDSRGLRYLVPDVRALDPASRGMLERYL